jgi:hypothetical protein
MMAYFGPAERPKASRRAALAVPVASQLSGLVQDNMPGPGSTGAFFQLEGHLHARAESPEAIHLDGGVVNVYRGAGGQRDEAIAARLAEPSDRSGQRPGFWEGERIPTHRSQATPVRRVGQRSRTPGQFSLARVLRLLRERRRAPRRKLVRAMARYPVPGLDFHERLDKLRTLRARLRAARMKRTSRRRPHRRRHVPPQHRALVGQLGISHWDRGQK